MNFLKYLPNAARVAACETPCQSSARGKRSDTVMLLHAVVRDVVIMEQLACLAHSVSEVETRHSLLSELRAFRSIL